MIAYCTAEEIGQSMGLAWSAEDSIGSDTQTNTVYLPTTVGRKYGVNDSIRLYNSTGSTEDATVSAITYGSSYTTLTIGSLTNASYFTEAKDSTCQIKSYFNGVTNPTKSVVEQWIGFAEDEIEAYTRRAWNSQGSFSGYIRWDPRRLLIIGEPHSWYKVRLPYPDPVTPLDSDSGDSLKVWNGGSEVEYVDVYTEGRTDDFWLDGKQYLYINSTRPWPENNSIYISYRYGNTSVPQDIKRACILLVKQMFNEANLYNNDGLTEAYDGGEKYPYQSTSTQFRNMAYAILKKRRRLIFG